MTRKLRLLPAIVCIVILNAVLNACGGAGDSGGGASDPPAPTTSVSGTVSFKGVPLDGVTVTNFLTNSNVVYQRAITDANGSYRFTGMSATGNVPGEYQIFANRNGYGFYPSIVAGATIKRADYTGQFQGVGQAPSGLFFSVIDFISLRDASVTGANFEAYDGSNPLFAPVATGQIFSYAAGDDGSAKKGVAWDASRFTDNQDGTVSDSLTGLTWLRDAGCLGSALWANALTEVNQLASGTCGLKDGSAAGAWRMPNLVELESLIDASAVLPALAAANCFVNVSNGVYWTSTSYYGGETGSNDAWAIRLGDGSYVNGGSANVKATSSNSVWAVRGGGSGGLVRLPVTGFYLPYAAGDDGHWQSGVPLASPRFIDHNNGTVTDTMTGLVWLKQANCISGQWPDALAAVNALASGTCGLTDGSTAGAWRTPNRNEMQTLADRAQTNAAQYFNYTYLNKDGSVYQAPIFKGFPESQSYWTSTSYADDTTQAWTVFSCDFGVYSRPKTDLGYVLAVR